MGFKCAALGVGTDIGGSIRAPAGFCGAYGFRPTTLRIPATGIKVPGPGQESIHGTAGPLASQSVEDLDLFQRAVIDQEPWETETSLVPLPWRRVKATENMTVGIMWDDGYFPRPFPLLDRSTDSTDASAPIPPSPELCTTPKKSSSQPA
jgi:Asp-tRNA(Asn)/Glu-tRNA(Gln) amidotransferase A subunit family amidase